MIYDRIYLTEMEYQLRAKEKKLGRALQSLTARAKAVDLDAMSDHFILGQATDTVKDVFHIIQAYVFSCAATDADEVVMMASVAQPVADAAIIEDDTADEALIKQELQSAIDGRPTYRGQLCGKLLGLKVILIVAAKPFDYLITGHRNLEALVAKFLDKFLGGQQIHALIISIRQ